MALDKQKAMKFFNTFFQKDPIGKLLEPNKRVALCIPRSGGRHPFIAEISGGKYYLPNVTKNTMEAWEAMLEKHEVEKRTDHDPLNCAEAHLWLKLVDMGQYPGHLDVYVAKKQKSNPRAKRDSPCRNCQQWARQEFRSINSL